MWSPHEDAFCSAAEFQKIMVVTTVQSQSISWFVGEIAARVPFKLTDPKSRMRLGFKNVLHRNHSRGARAALW